MHDMEFLGRDWAHVYRGGPPSPCQVCGRATQLIISFKPGTALRICGGCRGY